MLTYWAEFLKQETLTGPVGIEFTLNGRHPEVDERKTNLAGLFWETESDEGQRWMNRDVTVLGSVFEIRNLNRTSRHRFCSKWPPSRGTRQEAEFGGGFLGNKIRRALAKGDWGLCLRDWAKYILEG